MESVGMVSVLSSPDTSDALSCTLFTASSIAVKASFAWDSTTVFDSVMLSATAVT